MLRKQGTGFLHTSMEARGRGGIARAFMYGDEERESTGFCTIGSLRGMLLTSEGTPDPHHIFLDEPDLGLSDEAAMGAGVELGKFVDRQSPGAPLLGCFLVTHRTPTLRGFQEACFRQPHVLWVGAPGSAPQSLEAWLCRPIRPAGLDEVRASGRELESKVRLYLRSQGLRDD
jgi:hypothetical protein